MRGLPWVLVAMAAAGTPALSAQSVLERSPNTAGVWTLESGRPVFVLAHRFEFLSGGDEMINFPTLSLAIGLPLGFTAGLDFTSNSEIVATRLAGNETQYWLKRAVQPTPSTVLAGIAAYNSAAASADGAISVRQRVGRLAVVGELRGYRRLFGSGEAGSAVTLGGIGWLTPYLTLAGDWGRVLGHDSLASVWSAGLGIAIPGTPHTFSLHAANSGASTLQGMVREKRIGPRSARYGFVFTVPLGSRSQWVRIFRPAAADRGVAPIAAADTAVAVIEMHQVAFAPREVRIRAGQSVTWINRDPVVHTVTARDGRWGSGFLNEGDRFRQRFDRPGRYEYYCQPHPMMTGVVIVEP